MGVKKQDLSINTVKLYSMALPYKYKSWNVMYKDIVLNKDQPVDTDIISDLRSETLKKHIISLLRKHTILDEKTKEILELKNCPTIELDDNERLQYKPYFKNIIAKKINEEFKNGNYKFVMNTTKLLELGFLGKRYIGLRWSLNNSKNIKGYDISNKDGYSFYVIKNKLDSHIKSTINNILRSLSFPNVIIEKLPTKNYEELPKPLIDSYEAEKDELKNILEYEKRERTGMQDIEKFPKVKVDYRELPILTNERYKELHDVDYDIYENWIFKLDKSFDGIELPPDSEIEKDCKILNDNFILKFKQKTGYNKLIEYRNNNNYELLKKEIKKIEELDCYYNTSYNYAEGKLIADRIKEYLLFNKKNYFDIRYLESYIYDLNKIIEYTAV